MGARGIEDIARSLDKVNDFFGPDAEVATACDGPEDEEEEDEEDEARVAADIQRDLVLSSTGHASEVVEPLIGG